MKNKVYCTQCRYYLSRGGVYNYDYCCAPQNFKPVITPAKSNYKEYQSEIVNVLSKEIPEKLNKNNDCKYYSKHSWWKFYW